MGEIRGDAHILVSCHHLFGVGRSYGRLLNLRESGVSSIEKGEYLMLYLRIGSNNTPLQ